ncbi:hypothetical protein [Halobacillus trueperi]|uniref:hypothetical protein n=1 Tax=Halobacillus trueperi TaxID=156205 RepID=UPI00373605E3
MARFSVHEFKDCNVISPIDLEGLGMVYDKSNENPKGVLLLGEGKIFNKTQVIQEYHNKIRLPLLAASENDKQILDYNETLLEDHLEQKKQFVDQIKELYLEEDDDF